MMRYHFLPVDYLIKKAEDACVVMNDNDAYKAKECICTLRSVLVIVPEKEVRSLIVKTINKDKVGVKRILASNVSFMSAMVAANEDKECNSATIRFHNGVVKTYHSNGNIAQEQIWKNDKLTHIVSYYDNGNMAAETDTSDVDLNSNEVIKDGVLKSYYENGNLQETSYYKDGKLEGIQIAYYENGSLKSESTYKNGKLNGMVKSYYENGKIQREFNTKDGKLNGLAKEYLENGNLLGEINYKNDKLDGLMRVYYENNNIKQESNMKNNEPNGIVKNYRDDGTLMAEVNYKNGKLDGLNKRFYGDGSYCERVWNNGERQSQKCYDKDKNEITLNGLVKFYHKNGKMESETNYINGKAEGVSRTYYTKGNIER